LAVVASGIVERAALEELRRWGLPVDEVDDVKALHLEEAAARVRDALESEGYILVRETDLAVFEQFAQTMCQGVLHIVLDNEVDPKDNDLQVTFGRTPLKEYILPWKSTGIADVLTNGMTYLVDEGSRVYFREVRELFFGETKAFMICAPAPLERVPTLSAGE